MAINIDDHSEPELSEIFINRDSKRDTELSDPKPPLLPTPKSLSPL